VVLSTFGHYAKSGQNGQKCPKVVKMPEIGIGAKTDILIHYARLEMD